MILSPYDRELIVRSVAADRLREAEQIRGRNRAIQNIPRGSRQSATQSVRNAVGLWLIRAGARVAGFNPWLAPECR